MARYPKEVRQAAFERFMNSESFAAISDKMNIAVRTLGRWADDEDWQAEKEQRDFAPMKIDKALLFALGREIVNLNSMDEGIRLPAIDRVHKITSTRKKIGTNQIDKAPIAIELGGDFVEYVNNNIDKVVNAGHREATVKALKALLAGWYGQVLKQSKGALNAK